MKDEINRTKTKRGAIMKAKVTEAKCSAAFGRVGQLFSRVAWFGAVILICSGASAQNMFVSGTDAGGGEIFKFPLAGPETIFATGLVDPWDLAVDRAGNLFVVDSQCGELYCGAKVNKITPQGVRTILASSLSYPSDLAVDSGGNVFVADCDRGIIYEYKPDGSRATFASGLYHPVGPVFDSLSNLFVADNGAGIISQGSIYKYKPDGSRVTIAALDPGDRPADLALDSMGNLYMADLSGNIYRYALGGVLRRYSRTTFGSVPNSAQSLAFDSAGNLFVVDPGNANGNGNAIYKFTAQGARSTFAKGEALGESFLCVAFQPMQVCCQ
jgi:DNA-binding beta-propeller fold protein YncE